jgi:hypothetical protein
MEQCSVSKEMINNVNRRSFHHHHHWFAGVVSSVPAFEKFNGIGPLLRIGSSI